MGGNVHESQCQHKYFKIQILSLFGFCLLCKLYGNNQQVAADSDLASAQSNQIYLIRAVESVNDVPR